MICPASACAWPSDVCKITSATEQSLLCCSATGFHASAAAQPATRVWPPTEEALQRLSDAQRSEAGQPAARVLRHGSSSLTTGSSINTPSMCSTDTVLPRALNSTSADGQSSMRKRHTVEPMSSMVSLRSARALTAWPCLDLSVTHCHVHSEPGFLERWMQHS